MSGDALSVTTISLIAVGACPTTKLRFAPALIVAATTAIVFESLAFVAAPAPSTTSCSLVPAETAVKLANSSPETTI